MILSTLAGVGISFISDLIKDNGEDLVKEGIKKVTGIDLTKKKELTAEEINAIRLAEVELRNLDFKQLELEMENTNSARDMQKTALNQEDTFSKRFVYYYAIVMTVFTFSYIIAITFVPIPESSVRFADTVLGFLLGVGLASIINYFYGSSSGSKSKTEAMLKDK